MPIKKVHVCEKEGCKSVFINNTSSLKDHVIATTWRDGPYLLVVLIESDKKDVDWNLTCKPHSIFIISSRLFFKHKYWNFNY